MSDHPLNPRSVLEAITGGRITMRPKWQFVLEQVAVVVAIVFVAVGLVYLGSFIAYLWRSAQFSALPAFGNEGYRLLAREFPWWHGVFILLGGVALMYLIRRHTHLYRWPLSVTLGVVGLVLVAASWVAMSTPLHDQLEHRAFRGGLPIFGPSYRGNQPALQGLITPGTVTKVEKKALTMQSPAGTVKVRISDDTRIPSDWTPQVGNKVVVIGELNQGTIDAVGIRPYDRLPPRRPFRMDDPPAMPDVINDSGST